MKMYTSGILPHFLGGIKMTKFIEERVNDLEKEVAELKLIVHELRKSSTVEEVPASVVEDTIEFKGKQYKKVDRLAREGDVVVFKDGAFVKSLSFQFEFEKNKPYEVFSNVSLHNEFRVYELMYNRTPETVDVYELIEQPTVIVKGPLMAHIHEVAEKPKTANELRGEIIEKAKEFMESTKKTWNGLVLTGSLKGEHHNFENVYQVPLEQVTPFKKRVAACKADFIVNEEKRTVVALMRSIDVEQKGIYSRGIAKCNPSDVFNAHIGKAIALGRALNLDVSEFEQAVQPTEVVVGMEIEGLYNDLYKVTYVKDDEIGTNNGPARFFYKHRFENGQLKIINDTNAIYGGVE